MDPYEEGVGTIAKKLDDLPSKASMAEQCEEVVAVLHCCLPWEWIGVFHKENPKVFTLVCQQGSCPLASVRVGEEFCGRTALFGKTMDEIDGENCRFSFPIRSSNNELVALVAAGKKGKFTDADRQGCGELSKVLSRVPFPAFVAKIGGADKPTQTKFQEAIPTEQRCEVGGWRIKSATLPRMASQEYISALGDKLLVLSLPEIIFDQNYFLGTNKTTGVTLELTAEAVLRSAADYYQTDAYRTEKDAVKVPFASVWDEKRKSHETFEPKIDWAFRTKFLGLWKKGDEVLTPQCSEVRIDKKELQRQDLSILLFDAFELCEDDLHDHGLSCFSIKYRIMETFYFVLVRHIIRLDEHLLALRETRIFHSFETDKAQIEFSIRTKSLEGNRQTIDSSTVDRLVPSMKLETEEFFEVTL